VGRHVLLISVVDIICSHKSYACLFAHPEQLGIDHFLVRYPVILQLQKEVILPEDVPVLQGRLHCLLVHPSDKIPLYFSRQAGAQGYDPLMVLS